MKRKIIHFDLKYIFVELLLLIKPILNVVLPFNLKNYALDLENKSNTSHTSSFKLLHLIL